MVILTRPSGLNNIAMRWRCDIGCIFGCAEGFAFFASSTVVGLRWRTKFPDAVRFARGLDSAFMNKLVRQAKL